VPTSRILSRRHLQVLEHRADADAAVAAALGTARAAVGALEDVLASCGRALAGDLAAAQVLRGHLERALGVPPADYVASLAPLVVVADGGTLDPRFRLRRRWSAPSQELTAVQATLIAAAVRVARDPVEALAFALVAGRAADDVAGVVASVAALRDGRTDPGALVLPVTPQEPLRPPPGLEGGPLGGGPLGGGPLGGGPLGGGPLGGGPRGPGWHQLPPWITQVGGLRSTDCLAILSGLVAAVPRMAEEYVIDEVVGDDGCPGDPIELRGSGFGDIPGRVRFESTTGGTVSVRADDWSPTHLRLRVPWTAVGGPVGLLLPLRTVTACGRTVELYRAGRDGAFHGGVGQVARLTVAGLTGPGTVRSDVPVQVRFRTLPAPRPDGGGGAEVELVVRQTSRAPGAAPVDLVRARVPAGEGGVDLDLTGDRYVSDLTVVVRVSTRCGPAVDRVVDVVAAARTDLVVDPVELVQVLQSVDPGGGPGHNAVALVEGARTLARVHVRARHAGFDWGRGRGVLPVTGTLSVLAPVPTTVPVATATSAATWPSRDTRSRMSGWAHEIPYPLVVREGLQVRVDLRVDAAALGLPVATPWTRAEGVAAVTPSRPRRVLLLRAAVPLRLGLPTPSHADCLALLRAATSRLPVGVEAWDVYVHGLAPVLLADAAITSTDPDDARQAWDDLLGAARDVADDVGTDDGTLVVVVAPGSDCPVAGLGGDGFAAAQLGRPATLAHEIAHAVGVRHSACRPTGTHAVPDDPDRDLPTQTEVTGIDLHGTSTHPGPHVVPARTEDLMGYCPPTWAGTDPVWRHAPSQARWPSLAVHERLRRLL
jgi:hypothetical protein